MACSHEAPEGPAEPELLGPGGVRPGAHVGVRPPTRQLQIHVPADSQGTPGCGTGALLVVSGWPREEAEHKSFHDELALLSGSQCLTV